MNTDEYIDALRTHAASVSSAARRDAQALVPSCPGWAVVNLLGHLGAIYLSILKNVEHGHGHDIVNDASDLGLDDAYLTWFHGGRKAEEAPHDAADWFDGTAHRLTELFARSDASAPTWSWFPSDQTVGFWIRRMAHETAIHAWDAQLALGQTYDFDPDLAADGVDEILTMLGPAACRPQSSIEGHGETFHFHRTDGPGEWLVRFDGTGVDVTREHSRGDVAIRGTASNLFLYLWHRLPAESLEILGDPDLAARYFEFMPPD